MHAEGHLEPAVTGPLVERVWVRAGAV